MNIQVETELGLAGERIPIAFVLGGNRINVTEITDRWLSEEYSYYKVRIDGEAIYILRNNKSQDSWEITLYQSRPQIEQY